MRKFAMMALVLLTSQLGHAAAAKEPAYCDPAKFAKLERGNNVPNVQRAHVYQIGSLTLAGLAVGDSDANYVVKLAEQYSKYNSREKSCTWYFNDGNDQAAEMFHQRYVSNPALKSKKIATEYEAALKGIFSKEETNFVSCATDHKYIAMGCDGMKHRGPSVFAMILAFSGCSAKNATKIANNVWGKNFVSASTREAIAEVGFKAGNADPAGRAALQKIMTTVPAKK
ncbi:MAG: hypothetical protein V4692_15710 [Bdellovibrionota bacterium]